MCRMQGAPHGTPAMVLQVRDQEHDAS